MDFFVILGLFPLVSNIRGLVDPESKFKLDSFYTITIFASLMWLIWAIFTPLWWWVLTLLLINGLVFKQLKILATDNAKLLMFWHRVASVFTILMISWVITLRLGFSDELILFINNLF